MAVIHVPFTLHQVESMSGLTAVTLPTVVCTHCQQSLAFLSIPYLDTSLPCCSLSFLPIYSLTTCFLLTALL